MSYQFFHLQLREVFKNIKRTKMYIARTDHILVCITSSMRCFVRRSSAGGCFGSSSAALLRRPEQPEQYLGPVAPIWVNCTVSWLTHFTLLLLAYVATLRLVQPDLSDTPCPPCRPTLHTSLLQITIHEFTVLYYLRTINKSNAVLHRTI